MLSSYQRFTLSWRGCASGCWPRGATEQESGAGKPALRVYWYAKGSSSAHVHGGFYDAQGKQPYHGGWRSPVPMARISSRLHAWQVARSPLRTR